MKDLLFQHCFFQPMFFQYDFDSFLLPLLKQVVTIWLINKFMETILQDKDFINSEKPVVFMNPTTLVMFKCVNIFFIYRT